MTGASPPAPRAAIPTTHYGVQNGGLTAIAGLASAIVSRKFELTANEIVLLTASLVFVLNILAKVTRDIYYKKFGPPSLISVAILVLFLVACGHTPRQQFYMSEVAFSGAQSAAIAYLATPYGQEAPEEVLTAISEASDEGTATLQRLRPLVPAPGTEVPDVNEKLLHAGFDTMESVVNRLNRVLTPQYYED